MKVRWRERLTVRVICVMHFKNRKRVMDLMLIFCLNEATNRLAVESSVCWYVHMLRREDGHVSRRALAYEVNVQGKKDRPKVT